MRQPPAYLSDYVCKQIDKEKLYHEPDLHTKLSTANENNRSYLATPRGKYSRQPSKELPAPRGNNYHGLTEWGMKNSAAADSDEHYGLLQEFYLAPQDGAEPKWPHEEHALYEQEYPCLNCLQSHENRLRSPEAPNSNIILARIIKEKSAAAQLHSS